jgi:hypothetical protein
MGGSPLSARSEPTAVGPPNRYHMRKWPFNAAKNHADGLFYYSVEAETAKIIEGL